MQTKLRFSKKELLIKLALTFVIAIVLGVSCIFGAQIEKSLSIGISPEKSNYVSVESVQDDKLVVHYIDVGQADCTFIELPDGKNMVIDTGDISTATQVSDYIKAVLGTNNTINYLILTHSDSDHIGGAKKLLDNFEVENIYRPFAIAGTGDTESGFEPQATEELGTIYNSMRAATNIDASSKANAKQLPRITTTLYKNVIKSIYSETSSGNLSNVFVNYDGLEISAGGQYAYSIKWYAPLLIENDGGNHIALEGRTQGYVTKGYGATTAQGKNAISPVIKIEYNSKKFVFTGDIYENAEREVVDSLTSFDKQELSNITVYQAGHHGAKNSNTEEFLQIINPIYTVVSVGANNDYGHPTPEFLERIKNLNHNVNDYLLRTDLQGTIVFGVADDGVVEYAANVQIKQVALEIAWWHIAVGSFVVAAGLVFGIRIKPASAKKSKRKY